MTEQEYFDSLNKLKEVYKSNERRINLTYAYSNSKAGVGDVVESKQQVIKVSTVSVGFALGSNLPECVYNGELLTKKYKKRKHPIDGSVYQRDLLKVHKDFK